jgi:hypothetical protein
MDIYLDRSGLSFNRLGLRRTKHLRWTLHKSQEETHTMPNRFRHQLPECALWQRTGGQLLYGLREAGRQIIVRKHQIGFLKKIDQEIIEIIEIIEIVETVKIYEINEIDKK